MKNKQKINVLSIQFTYEIEKENEISFLDILIIHSEEKFETRVYRNLPIQTYTAIRIHMPHLHQTCQVF